MRQLDITQYYREEDRGNWSFAVQRVWEDPQNCHDCILHFPQNTYHFYPEGCLSGEYYPCNNDGSVKEIVFWLNGVTDVTIEGDGSTFLFHGLLSPFILDRCRGITIRNLDCDTGRPFFTQGTIVASGSDFVELQIDKEEFPYRVEGRNLIIEGDCWEHDLGDAWVLMQEFNSHTRGPQPGGHTAMARIGEGAFCTDNLPAQLWTLSASEGENGTVRLQGNLSYTMTEGNTLVFTHEKRYHSFAYVKDCAHICIENVAVHHAQSMGIIAQCTDTLTVKNCRYEVPQNSKRLISINADGVHCVNCSGLVHIADCVMDGMMDDGINVHGIYSLLDEIGKDGQIHLKHIHFQQFGVNVYFPGDEITFLDAATMQEVGTAIVEESHLEGIEYISLKLKTPVGVSLEKGMVTENRRRMPEVLIEGCAIGRNRPRGILMNTPKHAVIRNNRFYNSSSGVQLKGGPNFWGESGSTRDVQILNNRFEDCSYLDCAALVHIDQVHKHKEHGIPYHFNVVIRGNTFRTFCPKLVYARLVKGLTVEDNEFIKTDTYDDRGNTSQMILYDTTDVKTDIPREYIEILP